MRMPIDNGFLILEGRAPGTGGAALTAWFPGAVTLANRPVKGGGDDRAPGQSE